MTTMTKAQEDELLRGLEDLKKSTKPATVGQVVSTVMQFQESMASELTKQIVKIETRLDTITKGAIPVLAKAIDQERERSGGTAPELERMLKVERELSKAQLGEALELMRVLMAETRAEITERDERIAVLEKRVSEVEKAPFAYKGTHEIGAYYSRGSVVTAKGGLWHANVGTTSSPDYGNSSWTLCCKQGPAGKDAR